MGLSSDEKKLLEELSAKANEPDADEEYEIEIHDTATNRGARVPMKLGKKWLYDNFGIGDSPTPAAGEDGAPADEAPQSQGAKPKKSGGGSFFGRQE